MYDPQFILDSFKTLPRPSRLAVVGRLIDAMAQANMVDVQSGHSRGSSAAMGPLPQDPDGGMWQDAARIRQLGAGTPPSLVAWRIAELKLAGEVPGWGLTQDGRFFIQRANGSREDPTRGAIWTAGLRALGSNATWTPTLELLSFETTPAELKMTVLCKMLDVLHEANGQWLAAGNRAPALYSSGVHYQEEALGKDEWQDIPNTLERGTADCEDLASYRVSELRAGGEAAQHTVEHQKSPNLVLYHIRVRRQNGDIEDPSCRLGMSGACQNVVLRANLQAEAAKKGASTTQMAAGVAPGSLALVPGYSSGSVAPSDVAAAAMQGGAPASSFAITPESVALAVLENLATAALIGV